METSLYPGYVRYMLKCSGVGEERNGEGKRIKGGEVGCTDFKLKYDWQKIAIYSMEQGPQSLNHLSIFLELLHNRSTWVPRLPLSLQYSPFY